MKHESIFPLSGLSEGEDARVHALRLSGSIRRLSIDPDHLLSSGQNKTGSPKPEASRSICFISLSLRWHYPNQVMG